MTKKTAVIVVLQTLSTKIPTGLTQKQVKSNVKTNLTCSHPWTLMVIKAHRILPSLPLSSNYLLKQGGSIDLLVRKPLCESDFGRQSIFYCMIPFLK